MALRSGAQLAHYEILEPIGSGGMATVYKAKDAGPVMLETYGWWPMIIGSLAAWISAVAAVKWMVEYLKRHGMQLFGYYRVVLALAVGAALYFDLLTP